MDEHKARKKSRFGLTFVGLLLVVAIGFGGFFYHKYRDAVRDNPNRERDAIVQSIQEVVALPNEAPAFSTVKDHTKLGNSTLRSRAQNGDKLLIYSAAKRLIIYRPATGKVIDMLTLASAPPP